MSSTAARPRHTFSIVHQDERSLHRDCGRLLTSPTPGPIVLRLLMEANREAVGSFSGFATHAAVVGGSQRVAAVLGVSGVGKSTLAAAAAMAGLAYASDEALCIDRRSGEVIPYPRPLGLTHDSLEQLGLDVPDPYADTGEAPIAAASLTGKLLEPGRRLTDIVIPDRVAEGPPRFEALSPAAAATALLENSFNHYTDPQGSYELTARLASEVTTWQFTYSSPRDSGPALAEHLGT